MKKGQGFIVIIFFIFIMIVVIGFLVFILKSIKEVEESVTDPLIAGSNISNEAFGDPIKGSTNEEKMEKIKDPNIAPPELGG